MGGQLDIDLVEKCAVLSIDYPPDVKKHFQGPRFGIEGVRARTGISSESKRPLLGAIVKPKIGMSSDQLVEMVDPPPLLSSLPPPC